MSQSRPLLNLVERYVRLRYGASDIARAVGRSPERIRQVMRDLHLSRPRILTDDDIPDDLREQTLAIRKLQNRGEIQA